MVEHRAPNREYLGSNHDHGGPRFEYELCALISYHGQNENNSPHCKHCH